MKKENSRDIRSSLSILSAAKLKIFQKPVAVDVRRRGRRQGAIWEIKRIASKQPCLSTLLLQVRFFFSLYVISDVKKKISVISYSLKRMVTDSI